MTLGLNYSGSLTDDETKLRVQSIANKLQEDNPDTDISTLNYSEDCNLEMFGIKYKIETVNGTNKFSTTIN